MDQLLGLDYSRLSQVLILQQPVLLDQLGLKQGVLVLVKRLGDIHEGGMLSGVSHR